MTKSRSVWKGPYVHPRILKKLQDNKMLGIKKPLKVWSRASMIVPSMVGTVVAIHNGSKFVIVMLTSEMVNHKFGELVQTRKPTKHSVRKVKSTVKVKR